MYIVRLSQERDPSLNMKLTFISYTLYLLSLRVTIFLTILCMKQGFMVCDFPLVTSCWCSKTFEFEAFQILDLGIRYAQLVFLKHRWSHSADKTSLLFSIW